VCAIYMTKEGGHHHSLSKERGIEEMDYIGLSVGRGGDAINSALSAG